MMTQSAFRSYYETMMETETNPPFEILRPARQTRPLVAASPHSGRHYDRAFLASSRLGLDELRRSEDAHVDALIDGLPKLGVPVVQALFPRTYVDANREPLELDPGMLDGPLPAFANPDSPSFLDDQFLVRAHCRCSFRKSGNECGCNLWKVNQRTLKK